MPVSEEGKGDIILHFLRDWLKCQERVREREIINGTDSAFTNVSVCSRASREEDATAWPLGTTEMFSHPGPVVQPLTGPIIGVSVRVCVWRGRTLRVCIHMSLYAYTRVHLLLICGVPPYVYMCMCVRESVCLSVSERMALSVHWYNKWRQ